MRLGARIKAASEVLEDIFERHRPASTALADWGKAHRFAGSGDRAAIGTLVYDVLRRRQSLAAQMGTAEPRALALAAAPRAFGLTAPEVIQSAEETEHALGPLSEAEIAGLRPRRGSPCGGRGEYPRMADPVAHARLCLPPLGGG